MRKLDIEIKEEQLRRAIERNNTITRKKIESVRYFARRAKSKRRVSTGYAIPYGECSLLSRASSIQSRALGIGARMTSYQIIWTLIILAPTLVGFYQEITQL